MNYPRKEASIIAYFPEERYSKHGPILRICGNGTGSKLSVALNRAFKNVLKDPQIFHKSPLYIYISVGMDGFEPIDIWHRVTAVEKPVQP